MNKRLLLLAFALLAAAALLSGCVMRPDSARVLSDGPAQQETAPDATPEILYHTAEFRLDDFVLSKQAVEDGALPRTPTEVEGERLLGWLTPDGAAADPDHMPVTADTVYLALTRPLLNDGARWLFPRENGFLAPEALFTYSDGREALNALLADPQDAEALLAGWPEAGEQPMNRMDFASLADYLFAPAEAAAVCAENLAENADSVTRADAALCLTTLLDAAPQEGIYFPDAAPDHRAYDALCAAAVSGTLDREALIQQTLDDFLWFDGYLYRLDADGYFITDEEIDGLYYGPDGRFTSGSAELDGYVAKTVAELTAPEQTRRERLRAVYLHVKNDFKYLVRNYYESGAHGWEIPEALTLYETGKGNCYCYAGVFWSLARGLGYNATAYSGTMGNQNQPHAWTEIALDGEIYICDPEIEMNYWWLANLNHDNSMYTDNFMMLRRNADNWNYQSVGRE